MDQQRWREVRVLFDELVELPLAERELRLAELGKRAPALGAAVYRLIEADSGADARLAPLDQALLTEAGTVSGRADPLGLSGRLVSHFRVLELLGAGGMGAVYRAEDTRLGRIVALKVPLPAQVVDASGRTRFLREARAVAALDHPNVCDVHEVGESEDGHPFLAMPHYPGETLRDRLAREGALPEEVAVDITRQIAAGLSAAHRAGIVHRDLKPGNVMLLPDGSLKILDFGLAKVSDASVTATGDRLGTASYMAPEQIRGGAIDGRVDLWALGVMLYEMLTGRRPFIGESDVAVAHAILHETPAPPSRWRKVSPAVSDLVLRLLMRDPALRVASAADVSAELAPEVRAAQVGARRAVGRWLRRAVRSARAQPRAALAASTIAAGAIAVALLAVGNDPGPVEAGTADPMARNLYLRGRDYESRGRSSEDLRNAGILYRRAIDRDTGFALARARYAITELRLLGSNPSTAQLEDAAAHVRAALARAPALGDAHLAMGRYWAARSQPALAMNAYREARARLPRDGEVPLAIAELHLRAGRWTDAVGELERARELAPGDLETARLLGLTYSRLRRYESAAAAWELVTTLVPDDYNALLIKGYIHIRWRGTADTLESVLRRIPSDWNPNGMKTHAAVSAARIARNPTAALPILDLAQRLVSEDVYTFRPTYLMRAQVSDDLKDSAAARAWYARTHDLVEDTLAARPNDARLHIALGWAHAGLGRRDEAVAAANRAMALAPRQSNEFDGIPLMGAAAEVLARAGDAGAAVALLDSLLGMPAGREASVVLLRVDPTWDPIRSDPRFVAMLARHE